MAASATQMAATARGQILAETREEQVEAAEKSSEVRSSNDKLQLKLIGSGAIESEEKPLQWIPSCNWPKLSQATITSLRPPPRYFSSPPFIQRTLN